MKRFFDFTAAALGLLFLALPLLVLVLVIRRKLGSPVFFRQVRPRLTTQEVRASPQSQFERLRDGALYVVTASPAHKMCAFVTP